MNLCSLSVYISWLWRGEEVAPLYALLWESRRPLSYTNDMNGYRTQRQAAISIIII